MMLQAGPAPASAVRDTISAVFGQRRYDRDVARSLLDRLLELLARWWSELAALMHERPVLGRSLAIGAAVVVALFLARLAWVAWLRREQGATLGAASRGGRRAAGDPWQAAQRAAAAGDYTAAAHLLYGALREAIARRERIRLHPSKTAGDYVRDLRQRSSSLFTRFREFARTYEVVVYGIGVCDRERWERLYALASDIVGGSA